MCVYVCFCFSSRRLHTRCALVTGVQTCALPICILKAHRNWNERVEATDDAQMLRAAGHDVALVEGDTMLEKLTYPADFALAEERLARRFSTRTGMGYDVHRLVKGAALWLGGVSIPHDKGLSGHSRSEEHTS